MRNMLAANLIIVLVVSGFFAPLRLSGKPSENKQARDLTIELFQVIGLPLVVHEALLLKSEKGYLLKVSLANTSELKMIGLRYSLATIESGNKAKLVANRTEGLSIPPYETESLTFKTPIKFKPTGEDRLILMLEQVVSRESIWEVVKAKEAFDSYARADYSVVPIVLRVANQVDVPLKPRIIFR
jgi:hypothetical protein